MTIAKQRKNDKAHVRMLKRRPDLFKVLHVLKQWDQGHIPLMKKEELHKTCWLVLLADCWLGSNQGNSLKLQINQVKTCLK